MIQTNTPEDMMAFSNALRGMKYSLLDLLVNVVYGIMSGICQVVVWLSRCWAVVSWLGSGIMFGYLLFLMFQSGWTWQPLSLLVWALVSIKALHRIPHVEFASLNSYNQTKDRLSMAFGIAALLFMSGVLVTLLYTSWAAWGISF